MNILVILNANYIKALKLMLKSLFINHPNERLHIYLMRFSLTMEEEADQKSATYFKGLFKYFTLFLSLIYSFALSYHGFPPPGWFRQE